MGCFWPIRVVCNTLTLENHRIDEKLAVQVVFSRRRGDHKPIATKDLTRPARKVVADYLRRWAIEKKETVLRLAPLRQLKAELRQAVGNQAVKDVVRVSQERPVSRRREKLLAA